MAIEWVREDPDGRGTRKEQSRTEYLREFLILSDDADETEDAVRTATGVPRLYEGHPTAVGARVADIDVRPDQGSRLLWRAQISYATNVVPAESESRLDRPKGVRWTYTPTTEIIEFAYDEDGDLTVPVRNSAMQPFTPQPEKAVSVPTLHITRYQSDFDPDLPLAYESTVNSDVFFGAPSGLARFVSAEATLIYEAAGNLWSVDYTFQFKRKGWSLDIADMGFYEFLGWDIINGTPKYGAIKQRGANGKKLMDDVTSPVYLNAAGREAINGETRSISFKIYKPKAYAPLNLE